MMTDDEIFERVQHDILTAMAQGLTINMTVFGVHPSGKDGKRWKSGTLCSVCAIGAALRGHKVVKPMEAWDFARIVGRSNGWGDGYADGTILTFRPPNRDAEYDLGWKQGKRILAWVRKHKLETA